MTLSVMGDASYYEIASALITSSPLTFFLISLTMTLLIVKKSGARRSGIRCSSKELNPGRIYVPAADGMEEFLRKHEEDYTPLSKPAHVVWHGGSRGEKRVRCYLDLLAGS